MNEEICEICGSEEDVYVVGFYGMPWGHKVCSQACEEEALKRDEALERPITDEQKTMTDKELHEALDGLFASDQGATDSGIDDEALRQKCIAGIKAMPHEPGEFAPRLWLSRLIRDMFLSEERLVQGYGIEDAVEFFQWMEAWKEDAE